MRSASSCPRSGEAVILPEVISKEPLGPVTRADEFAWFNVVRWVNFALVNAEELSISPRMWAMRQGLASPTCAASWARWAGCEAAGA